MTEDRFCPSCGQPTSPEDRFCRNCGAALEGSATTEPPAPAASRRRHGPVLVAGLALIISAGAAVAVLAAGGVFSGSEKPAEKALIDPRIAQRQRLAPHFQQQMDARDEFFAAERDYRTAMRSAQRTLRDYRRADRDYKAESKRISEEFADEFDECARFNVPCPDPDYPSVPKVPSFSEPTKDLRASAKQLSELQATIAAMQPPAELRALQTQLVTAVTTLREIAQHNADVFSEAVEEPEYEAAGRINKGKIATLRAEDLPSIRALNSSAVKVIRELGLALSRYDLPGGRDIDPHDASQEV